MDNSFWAMNNPPQWPVLPDGTKEKVQETVTDENGHYTFDNVEEGDYEIIFVNPQDVTKKSDTPDGKNSIADGLKDANGNPAGAVIGKVHLPSDEDVIKMIEDGTLPDGNYVIDKQDAGFVANKPQAPQKKELSPYEGIGTLGAVKVGDQITYEISFQNYYSQAQTVVIKDTLDANVEFVKASNDGKLENGAVVWTLENVEAGKTGAVTVTVKVKEGALKTKQGPGKVVNGGETATVQVGNGTVYKLNLIQNPVNAEQQQTTPSGSSSSGSSSAPRTQPRTGDSPMLYVYIGISLAALIMFIILGVTSVRRRRTENKK